MSKCCESAKSDISFESLSSVMFGSGFLFGPISSKDSAVRMLMRYNSEENPSSKLCCVCNAKRSEKYLGITFMSKVSIIEIT